MYILTIEHGITWNSVWGWLTANESHEMQPRLLLAVNPPSAPSLPESFVSSAWTPWLGEPLRLQKLNIVNLHSNDMDSIWSWPMMDLKVGISYFTHWWYEGSLCFFWQNSTQICPVKHSKTMWKYLVWERGCIVFLWQKLAGITNAAILSALIKLFN